MAISYRQQLKYDELWEKKFRDLLKYKELYGTANVPNRPYNLSVPEWERRLAQWCNTQRCYYKREELKTWRYDKLVSVGFDFDPFTTRFEQHFEDFLKFKAEFGHTLVPQDYNVYPSLGAWVSHLRSKDTTPERRKRLDEAGFVWNSINEFWQNMFRELVAFKSKYGHFKVSEKRKGFEQLGCWTVRMRKAKRYGLGQKLSEEQIKLLDSIGFDWEPLEADWERNIRKLLLFRSKYGHCYVPNKGCEIEGLGWWVYWLRKNRHKLSREKIEQLDGLGFEWDADRAYRKRNNIKPRRESNGVNGA